VLPRDWSRSTFTVSARDARYAGTSPETMAAAAVAATVNASTRASMSNVIQVGGPNCMLCTVAHSQSVAW
jgi:hypothetical protein